MLTENMIEKILDEAVTRGADELQEIAPEHFVACHHCKDI